MTDGIRATLVALEDVHGVQGSFVFNAAGALVAMNMPALVQAEMLADLGPRVGRLAESFALLGHELDTCLVRFADHMLAIKQFGQGGALCVLVERTVNLSALRMGVNLAERRIAREIATAAALPPHAAAGASNGAGTPSSPQAPTDAAAASDEPPPARKAALYYRGHRVED